MNQIDHTTSKLGDSQQPNNVVIVHSLLELRGRYEKDRRKLQGKMDTLLRKMEAVDLLIDSETEGEEIDMTADGIQPEEVVVSTTSDIPKSDGSTDEADPVSGAATVQDIMHCRTQREAGYVIAEINGGFIDLKSAARVIKSAGLSKGMLNTVVSSLHHFMSQSSDWKYKGPSAFELLTHQEGAPESGSKADSGDEDSPRSKVVQDDSMMSQILNESAA